MSLPATQTAIAMAGPRQPLVVIPSSPVHPPSEGEVTIRVIWTSTSPLELHRNDGGLLVESWPFLCGSCGVAGPIVAISPVGDTKGLSLNDHVTSFAFRGGKEANHQEYITVPAYLVSKIPVGIAPQAAVTVPRNLVTVFHSLVHDLGLLLPWPKPDGWKPEFHDANVLVWGASSSVGVVALQVLRHWGYTRILAVASARQHAYLATLGATACFDYTKLSAVADIRGYLGGGDVPFVLDCIGSLRGSLEPLTQIATKASIVAAMLPVILKDATVDEAPEYEMDASKCFLGKWAQGVQVRGVRTHFYLRVR